jgi:PKD repeat protein
MRIFFLILFIYPVRFFGQTIELQNHRFGGQPAIFSSNHLYLEGQNHVWTNNENFTFPSRNTSISGVSYTTASLGLLPCGNAIVQAWKSTNGQTWLASRYLPACTQWPTSCNGGIIKAGNLGNEGTFQLFNSLTYVAMQNITESIWNCGVPVEGGNSVWLASEIGIRKLDVNTLASTLISKNEIPIAFPLTESKSVNGTPFFRNPAYQWVFIQNNQVQPLDPSIRFGLPAQTRISDLSVSGADTFLLADTSAAGNPVFHLFKKGIGSVSRIDGVDSVEKIATQQNGTLWFSRATKGFCFFRGNVLTPIPFFQEKTVVDFVLDSVGQKWVLTSNSELFRISDVAPRIKADSILLPCSSGSWQFQDVSTSLNGSIQSRIWDFGDGQTSTEANLTHHYEREGEYVVSLTSKDIAGSESSVKDTLWVAGSLYLNIRTPSKTTSCSNIALEAFGNQGFNWIRPGGSTDSSRRIMADKTGWYIAEASKEGCVRRDSVQIQIEDQFQEINIDLFNHVGQLQEQTTVYGFTPLTLSAGLASGNDACNGTWTLNEKSLGDSMAVSFTLTEPGKYILEWKGINGVGCNRFGKKELSIENPTIPNLVTRNGDDFNEAFQIPGTTIESLEIFNRWGKEIFNVRPYQNNWPPSDLGSGTFFYRLQANGKVYTGWVEIVR